MATTQITLNIDNLVLPDAIAALNWKSGYQANIPNPADPHTTIPNPQTPAQNAKAQLAAYTRNAIIDYKAMQAQTAVIAPDSTTIS